MLLFKTIRLSARHCLCGVSDVLFMSHWWQVLNWWKVNYFVTNCVLHKWQREIAADWRNKEGRREERKQRCISNDEGRVSRQKTVKLKWSLQSAVSLKLASRSRGRITRSCSIEQHKTTPVLPRRHCCSFFSHEEYYFTLWCVFKQTVKNGDVWSNDKRSRVC